MGPEHTINRKEIASTLKISDLRMHHLAQDKKAKMPKPIARKDKFFLYNRAEIMAWLDTKPLTRFKLKEVVYVKQPPKILDCKQARLFLSGAYDRNHLKKERYLKRLESIYTQPKTVTVHLKGDF